MRMLLAVWLVCLSSVVFAQEPRPPASDRLGATPPGELLPSAFAHTFSIVARDPATGEIGVAVQSHWFAVGQSVPWAEAGVGAVATQSFIDPDYGARGLALMREGKSASEALGELLKQDPHADVRQVAMIDARGEASAWTGKSCIPPAGEILGPGAGKAAHAGSAETPTAECADCAHSVPTRSGSAAMQVGANFSVQANLMSNDRIWPAMATAFEHTSGDLAERMLAALDAAQAAGGDIRGRQSAALIVVSGTRTETPWRDRIFDLRVDDSPEPLKELRRLVTLQRAYNHMNAGDLATEKHDSAAALREYGAAEALVPNDAEMIYWHAAALVNMGRVEEALPLFRRCFALNRNWAELTPRLATVGLLPNDPAVVRKIVAQAK